MNILLECKRLGLVGLALLPVVSFGAQETGRGVPEPGLKAGIAFRDITPDEPIWLAGKKLSEVVDSPLLVQALALEDEASERFVFLALDNCEVSQEYCRPVMAAIKDRFGLTSDRIMIVSSHTHSAPVLEHTLTPMYNLSPELFAAVRRYSQRLQTNLIEVVGAALNQLKPVRLEHGIGQASFAMNRRVYREDRIDFGENPEGPVDWDVPVLKVIGPEDSILAILFGYSCHGTSISGEDFYQVSGDFMAYARQHLEAVYPGAAALFLTGMGADSNPSPRGSLLDAKRHGMELAGAVIGVLNRRMRPISGRLRLAYAEPELPFEDPPSPARLAEDSKSSEIHVRNRAAAYQKLLDEGKPLPASVKLPVSVLRIGDDLIFIAMGGEVVVDYANRLKRLFAADHPWLIGYAYEVPCYIPSMRILKEGGYEAQSSLIYYGYYGPFRGRIEDILVKTVKELIEKNSVRIPP